MVFWDCQPERLLEQYAVIPTIDGHKLPFYAVCVPYTNPTMDKMACKMSQKSFSGTFWGKP